MSKSDQAERLGKKGERVAIVAGLRTPFAKQWSAYREVSALDLGKIVVNELLQRTGVDPSLIEQVVYGQVVPSVHAPNIAREVVLGTGMPRDIDAFSVSRACATSCATSPRTARSPTRSAGATTSRRPTSRAR